MVRAHDGAGLAALSPLLTQHINKFGRFELDMGTRLPLEKVG
jgi:hypothetical protein